MRRNWKRWIAGLLTAVMLVTMLPTVAYAAVGDLLDMSSVQRTALLAALEEVYGDDAEAYLAILKQYGLIDEDGNLVTDEKIVMDGQAYTLDEIEAILEDPATDLTKVVEVDGQYITLEDLKTVVEIERYLAYLKATYFTEQDLTDEQIDNFYDLAEAWANGDMVMLAADALEGVGPAGVDHDVRLTVTGAATAEENGEYIVRIEDADGKTERKAKVGAETEYGMVSLLFDAFCAHTGKMPRWGMLTGIHPIKLLRQLTEQHGEAEAARLFREKYFVSNEKSALAVRTLRAQKPITDKVRENDYSLYISVPFCPTRCAYCSFVSQSVEKAKKQIPEYHRLLLEELKETAKVADALGLNLRAVYVGGGTPTTFSAEQLSEMIRVVKDSFDMSQCEELTVEAGRPDTIDRAKLEALLKSGVSRISINPQTLQDNVLENIGRRHTAQQTVDAFHLAREAGFTNINMDLIVGLPGDTYETFCDTIEKVIALDPENVTVHALALKRSSFITQSGEINKAHADAALADRMMAYAEKRLTERGLEPYYLYRQSRMAGNLENTGWAKPGTECAYNIFTMDETETVLACGAGGVTKLKNPYSEDLSRIFNFKYSYEYISRYPEILERKEGIAKQYEQFRKRLH